MRARAAREGGLGVGPASVPEVGFAGRTVRRHVLILRIRGADFDNRRRRRRRRRAGRRWRRGQRAGRQQPEELVMPGAVLVVPVGVHEVRGERGLGVASPAVVEPSKEWLGAWSVRAALCLAPGVELPVAAARGTVGQRRDRWRRRAGRRRQRRGRGRHRRRRRGAWRRQAWRRRRRAWRGRRRRRRRAGRRRWRAG